MSGGGAKRQTYLDPPPELASFKNLRTSLSLSRKKNVTGRDGSEPLSNS